MINRLQRLLCSATLAFQRGPVQPPTFLSGGIAYRTKQRLKTAALGVIAVASLAMHAATAGLYAPAGAGTNFFTSDAPGGRIVQVTPAGSVSTYASGFAWPEGTCFDRAGNLYVCELQSGAIAKVTPGGTRTTFASIGSPHGSAFDSNGNLFVSSSSGGFVQKFSPTGVGSTFATGISGPTTLAFDGAGNLLVAESGALRIRKYSAAGNVLAIYTSPSISGSNRPHALAFDNAGNLYVGCESGTNIVRFSPTGQDLGVFASTARSGNGNTYGLAFDSTGILWAATSAGIQKFDTSGAYLGTIGSGTTLYAAFAPTPTQTQTLTILGGYGTTGTTDAHTEYYDTASGLWKPAYLTGAHPWGFLPGTNSWINFNPSPFVGLYTTTLYRVRFTAPDSFTNPHMKFQINADNIGSLAFNGVAVGNPVYGGNGQAAVFDGDTIFAQQLRPGENTINLTLTDQGGWVGFNFRIDLQVDATQPLVIVPIVPTSPVAQAGVDQVANEGVSVTLNGSASHDTNDPAKTLTYSWTQVSGPGVTLVNPTTATPHFTTPSVPASGATLIFQVLVSNGVSTAAIDTVTVTVVNVNNPPTATAGQDQTVGENTLVTLHGSASDLDADALTLHWTQVAGFGPTVQLAGADGTSPTFTAPDVSFAPGVVDLKFQLVANDGMANSGPSTVTIHVQNTNDAPTANAGFNQSVNELDPVVLDGTVSSDPDGNALTYSWSQVLGTPWVSLTGENTAHPTFQAPALDIGGMDGGTTLTFQLVVNDGTVDSAPSTVNVRVSNVNHAPLADAGIDQTVPENTLVTLSGANSADTDGDPLSFSWVQTGGPSVILSGAAGATKQDLTKAIAPEPAPVEAAPAPAEAAPAPVEAPKEAAPAANSNAAIATFTTPDVGPDGAVLTFQLTVNDGYGGVSVDYVDVNVAYVNRPPVDDAGSAQTVNEGETANLAGTASDPDNNPLAIAWSQVSGPAVTIVNGASLAPSFVAPLVTRDEADVVLRLTVDDGYLGTASSDVTVHIANINHAPTAQAPANMSVTEGSSISLVGQGFDADSEEQSQLSYAWQQIAPVTGPSNATSSIALDAPMVTAGGDPNAKVTLTFRLAVTDPNGVSATDDVDVVVTNVEHAPTGVAGGNLHVNEAASVTLNGSASSDPDGDALTYTWVQTAGPSVILSEANTAFPYFTAPFVSAAGTALQFKLTVEDGFGGSSSDCATVAVANINDPPTAPNATASLGTLWPPDHSMVKVSINGVVDPNNNATIVITGVTQDEATNGLGDGDTAVDAIINADGTVLLRAERSGKGNGRVYHVHFTASDFEGSVSGVVKVGVPHDKKGEVAIDGGELFDSTH